jgi:hypothetical protein
VDLVVETDRGVVAVLREQSGVAAAVAFVAAFVANSSEPTLAEPLPGLPCCSKKASRPS